MIYGIFTGHSSFSRNAVESAEQIIGAQKNYSTLSNKDLSSDELFDSLKSIVKDNPECTHFFVFVDFYGSSISLPSVRLKTSFDGKISIIFGYNMPMILDFFLHRENKSVIELHSKLLEVGKMGIR